MAQYRLNRELAALTPRRPARPVTGGCSAWSATRWTPVPGGADGEQPRPVWEMDYQGLFSHQVRGFGLGVMNARAAYYARKDPRFASFLTEGRSFGPHGEDLVIANSIDRYDDGLSCLLTERTVHANLQMREMGFKPYVAPAPVLRGPEPAVPAGPVALLLHLSGRGCSWGPGTGCSPPARSWSVCPAPGPAGPSADHHGPPAGHRLRGRRPCPSPFCCRKTPSSGLCGPCWSRCCLRAASSAARRTAWKTWKTAACFSPWPWTPAAATWPITGCSRPCGPGYPAAGQRGRGHRHRRREFYTKDVARDMVFAANQAGCAFLGPAPGGGHRLPAEFPHPGPDRRRGRKPPSAWRWGSWWTG